MSSLHELAGRFRRLYLAGLPESHAQMQPAGSTAKYLKRHHPLTDAALIAHLTGNETFAAPLIGSDGFTREVALDIDAGGEGAIRTGLTVAAELGFTAYGIVCSGGDDGHNGGHIRIPLSDVAAPERARLLAEQIRAALLQRAGLPDNTIEMYPTRKGLRLPLGVHTWTGKRGVLVLQDGRTINLDSGGILTLEMALDLIESITPTNPDALPPSSLPTPDNRPTRSRTALQRQDGDNPIQTYIHTTNLADWLITIGARVAYQTSQGGLLFHCPCPHHKHQDEKPSLELQPAKSLRHGRYVLIGHAPSCTFATEPGRIINAFDAYCRWEQLSTKEAIKQLYGQTTGLPAPRPRVPQPQRRKKSAEEKTAEDELRHKRVTDAQTLHIDVRDRAAHDIHLTERAKLVLDALLRVAINRGCRSWCRPSIARLSHMTGQCRRTIFRGLADLERAGYITSEQPTGQTTTIRHFLRMTADTPESSILSPMFIGESIPTPTESNTCEQGPDDSATHQEWPGLDDGDRDDRPTGHDVDIYPLPEQQIALTVSDRGDRHYDRVHYGPAGAVAYENGAAYVPAEAQEWYDRLITGGQEQKPCKPVAPEAPGTPEVQQSRPTYLPILCDEGRSTNETHSKSKDRQQTMNDEPRQQQRSLRPPTEPVRRRKYFTLLGAAKKAKNEHQARRLRSMAAGLLEEEPIDCGRETPEPAVAARRDSTAFQLTFSAGAPANKACTNITRTTCGRGTQRVPDAGVQSAPSTRPGSDGTRPPSQVPQAFIDPNDPWVQLQRFLLERAEQEGQGERVAFYRRVLYGV
jgi:hypothetical protein